MNSNCFLLGLTLVSCRAFALGLPVITAQPLNQTVAPGSNVVFTVSATGASGYQWRFNGADIPGAIIPTLAFSNVQFTNAGYYLVVVKNSTGWVPSRMAYLSVATNPGGAVPFSNTNIPQTFQTQVRYIACGTYSNPVNDGLAQVFAGPELDQMQPCGAYTWVDNGYYYGGTFSPGGWFPLVYVPTIEPGRSVYYQVAVTFPFSVPSCSYTQLSTVLNLVAGGGIYPTPSATGIKFPGWPEWPEPYTLSSPETNQVRVLGENVTLSCSFFGYRDFGIPTYQWRKDGKNISDVKTFESCNMYFCNSTATFAVTNVQPADAGIYDIVIRGNNWFVTPKIAFSVQVTNGQGVFQSPRVVGSAFLSDLVGAPGRNYAIESSTNLSSWNALLTLKNITGTVTLTNALSQDGIRFYRARLLP